MARTTGTTDINGSGSPATAIAAVGFADTTCAAVDGIVHTPEPVIVITAITTVIMIATMIATTIAVGIAIKRSNA